MKNTTISFRDGDEVICEIGLWELIFQTLYEDKIALRKPLREYQLFIGDEEVEPPEGIDE